MTLTPVGAAKVCSQGRGQPGYAAPMRRSILVATMLASALVCFTADTLAAPPWVDRSLTLPSADWAFDLGGGIAHVPDTTSFGVNLEMGVGITEHVELGVRTGLRAADEPGRAIQPDDYGRLFDRQYFDGGDSAVANPEVRVRWGFLHGSVAEMGLEGRFIAPLENGTYAGLAPGLPIALHLGDRVRLDTGVWMPVVFLPNHAAVGLSVPLDVWIQVTSRLWLGPMTGIAVPDVSPPPPANSVSNVSFGLGLGYQITHYLDFKTMLLFPAINNDSRIFGVGAGVQIRIE